MEGEEKKVKRKNETGGGGARGRGKQGRRGNENVDLLSCIPRGQSKTEYTWSKHREISFPSM